MDENLTLNDKIRIVEVFVWFGNSNEAKFHLCYDYPITEKIGICKTYAKILEEARKENFTGENLLEYLYNKKFNRVMQKYRNAKLNILNKFEKHNTEEEEIDISDDSTVYEESEEIVQEELEEEIVIKYTSFANYSPDDSLYKIVENPEFQEILKKIENMEDRVFERKGNWRDDLKLILIELKKVLANFEDEYRALCYFIENLNHPSTELKYINNIVAFFKSLNAFKSKGDTTNVIICLVNILLKFHKYFRIDN